MAGEDKEINDGRGKTGDTTEGREAEREVFKSRRCGEWARK